MGRTRLLISCLLVLCLCCVSMQAPTGELREEELKERIADLQRRIESQREANRKAMRQRLGDRYKVLSTCSVEELKFAISEKVHETYEGATVLSAEHEPVFLGTIDASYKTDSIFCDFGQFGSPVGAKSIWNEVGQYGGSIGKYSPFNTISFKPPLIVKNNRVIGRLTVNRAVLNAVDPNELKAYFKN